MPKIGLEGVKNSALWQLALIYWTNPTDSMPKMIQAVIDKIKGQIKYLSV